MASRLAMASAVVSGSLIWCGSASAVLIDDFVNANPAQEVQTLTSPVSISSNHFANTISNQRSTNYQYETEVNPTDEITLGVDATTGRMVYHATLGANGLLDTSYDTSAGVTQFNFANEAGFRLDFQPLPNDLSVFIQISDGTNTSTVFHPFSAGSTIIDVPFADFSGSADRSALQSMFFRFNAAPDDDFELNSISTYVPEPASLSLLGLGALALLRRRGR